jgi:protein-S-isoprenylcysteine O-methyltransferase Ste14
MMRRITRAIIFIVSILSSYLITGAIEERIRQETERFRPLTATAIGMAIIVLIFVPIFSYTDRITEAAVKAGLQQTKSGAGKVVGVIAFVVVVALILFALYLDRWFQISILDAL